MAFTRKKYRTLNRIFGLTCIAAILVVTSVLFLTSRVEYNEYERQYNAEMEEILSKSPKAPKKVYIDNEYLTYGDYGEILTKKSKHNFIYTCLASEAKYSSAKLNNKDAKVEVYDRGNVLGTCVAGIGPAGGGSIEFNIDVEKGTYADIDLVLSSAFYRTSVGGNTSTEGLTNYVKITLEGINVVANNVTLPVNGKTDWYNFQHLILENLHLKAGNNKLKLETKTLNPDSATEYVLPNISRIHVFGDSKYNQNVVVNGDAAFLNKIEGKCYFNFSATANGYFKARCMLALCKEGEVFNRLTAQNLDYRIVDGRCLFLVDCSALSAGTYFCYFYVDGEPFDTGFDNGAIVSQNLYYHYRDTTISFMTVDNATAQFINGQITLVIA